MDAFVPFSKKSAPEMSMLQRFVCNVFVWVLSLVCFCFGAIAVVNILNWIGGSG